MFKLKNEGTRIMIESCSKLTKTIEQCVKFAQVENKDSRLMGKFCYH